MPVTESQLNQLNSSIQSTLKPILAASVVANPASASILFGVDMIFRFVTLGAKIREKINQSADTLNTAVRADGIFRAPIEIDMQFSEILSFFTEGNCQLLFPIAYNQFVKERQILINQSDPKWQEVFNTLVLARKVLPEVYFDLKFDNDPLLDRLFGKWLDPADPNFRSLIIEMKPFCLREEISLNDLAGMIPEYSRIKLELMGTKLELVTQTVLDKLNTDLRGIILEAITGDQGITKSVTKFSIDRVLEQIDNQIAELNSKKSTIEAKPEAERSEGEKKELQQFAKRIDELTKRKANISSALS